MEEDILFLVKLLFCKIYANDAYIRQENRNGCLFEILHSFYPNIKSTIEKNPTTFLDITIMKR